MAETAPERRVFISYSRADRDFADRIENSLAAHRMTTWIDRKRLAGGGAWVEDIRQAIETSDALVVIISPRALASEIVRREYQYALSLKKLVVPILYKRVAALPPDLADIQWSDCTREGGLYHLLYTLYSAGLIQSQMRSGELSPVLVLALSLHNATPPEWQAASVIAESYLRLLIRYSAWALVSLILCVILAITGLGAGGTTILTPLLQWIVQLWPAVSAHPALAHDLVAFVAQELALIALMTAMICGAISYECWNLYTGAHLGEQLVITPGGVFQRTLHLSGAWLPGLSTSRMRYCFFSNTRRLDRPHRWLGGEEIIIQPAVELDARGKRKKLIVSSRYASPAATAVQVMSHFWRYAQRQETEAQPKVDATLHMVQRGARLKAAVPAPPSQG